MVLTLLDALWGSNCGWGSESGYGWKQDGKQWLLLNNMTSDKIAWKGGWKNVWDGAKVYDCEGGRECKLQASDADNATRQVFV